MLTAAIVLVACTGGSAPTYSGTDMQEYLPLDGIFTVEYATDDTAFGYNLLVTKLTPTEQDGSVEIVTLQHSNEETGEVLGAVKWSNSAGLRVHAYRVGAEGDFTAFDTPVSLASETMFRGDVVTTETNGMSFSSELLGFESCPVPWGQDWDGCAHLSLDDGGAGLPFSGDYWLISRYGVAWMQLADMSQPWKLADHDWAEEAR